MKPGARVMLVWGCCAEARAYIGWVGELENIEEAVTSCAFECGAPLYIGTHGCITVLRPGAVPIAWLKQMPDDPAPDVTQDKDLELTV